MSVTIKLPEGCKPADCYGAWIGNGDTDVHALIEQNKVVIGVNKDGFAAGTTTAIVLDTNSAVLQYADDNGKVVQKDIPPAVAYKHIRRMLSAIKEDCD